MELVKSRVHDIEAYTSEDSKEAMIFKKEDLLKRKVRVESINNFPTASGLASSSSGLSCLSYILARLYGVKEEFPGEYSMLARLGSGSACRSLYGGFVQWQRGFE